MSERHHLISLVVGEGLPVSEAPTGSRPSVIRKDGRKSIRVFGALKPETGWTMATTFRHANTESMQVLLDQVAWKIRRREHAVMILDGAGWHHSKQLRWHQRISPLFLPPFSLDLDPTERLRLWLRNNHCSNRVHADEVALEAIAKESHPGIDRRTLRSVCPAEWITHTDQR